MLSIALGLAAAAVIGLSLGLLGGGGSILTVPVLVYVLGYAAKPAIAMSLPVVGITSLVGTAMHWRLGHARWAIAATFGVLAMVGAFAGARLSMFVTGTMQLALLAVVMLAAAGAMLRRRPEQATSVAHAPRAGRLAIVALGVGLLTGIVGIGGGFLVVPALVLFARVPMRDAVGTSLLVIALNSAAGFAGYLGSVAIDWRFLGGFTAVAVVGSLAGVALSRVVPQAALRRVFGLFLIAVGASALYQNRGALRRIAEPLRAQPRAPADRR